MVVKLRVALLRFGFLVLYFCSIVVFFTLKFPQRVGLLVMIHSGNYGGRSGPLGRGYLLMKSQIPLMVGDLTIS